MSNGGDLYLLSAVAADVGAVSRQTNDAAAGTWLEEANVCLLRSDATLTEMQPCAQNLGSNRPFVYLGDIIDFGVKRVIGLILDEHPALMPEVIVFCGDGRMARNGESSVARITQSITHPSIGFASGHSRASVIDALWLLRLLLDPDKGETGVVFCADSPPFPATAKAVHHSGYAAILVGTDPSVATWRFDDLETTNILEREDRPILCAEVAGFVDKHRKPGLDILVRCAGASSDVGREVAARIGDVLPPCGMLETSARANSSRDLVWTAARAVCDSQKSKSNEVLLWTYDECGVAGVARLSRRPDQ